MNPLKMTICEFFISKSERKNLRSVNFCFNFRKMFKENHPRPITIHFDPFVLSHSKGTMIYHSYPYQSVELSVLFVYGDDFEREMSGFLIPQSVQTLNIIILVFLITSATILYMMRRKLTLRRNDFMLSFMDVMVTFTSGSSLQMQHRAERLFFGVLLFAAFFITLIYTGDVLFYIYRLMDQQISTFEQLAIISPPIYVIQSLQGTDIESMLRYVYQS